MDHTTRHMAPYERIIQSQKEHFISNVEATSIRQLLHNCYDRTPLFSQCKAKEAPILVMPSYDPPAALHNDHSQMSLISAIICTYPYHFILLNDDYCY